MGERQTPAPKREASNDMGAEGGGGVESGVGLATLQARREIRGRRGKRGKEGKE